MGTKIEWTNETWNPVTGCTPISLGCQRCYAESIAKRFWGDRKFTDVQFHEERLKDPLRWRKPRMVFVNSMSDLFHQDVSFETITRIFDVMCSWRWPSKAAERDGDESLLVDPGHIYQVLTKRPERIPEWLDWVANYWPGDTPFNVAMDAGCFPKHIWLGVTAESPDYLWRIEQLLQIPAAVRFISVEPMLGPVEMSFGDNLEPDEDSAVGWGRCDVGGIPHQHFLGDHCDRQIDWVIVGCESGPKRRPCKREWMLDLYDQCEEAGVPRFFKQAAIDGEVVHDANRIAEWMGKRVEDIRQFPQETALRGRKGEHHGEVQA